MSRENVELIRSAIETFNRAVAARDFQALARLAEEFADSDVEYVPVEEETLVLGRDALLGYWRRWLDAWAEIRWEVEEILPVGERVVGDFTIVGRGNESGVEIGQRLVQLYDIRDGKVVRIGEYLEREDALEAVGLSE